MEPNLNRKILARGEAFFAAIEGERPTLFDKGRWMGVMLDWCMRNPGFKTQMFRFVDLFPSLTRGEQLTRHLDEYFGHEEEVPKFLQWGAQHAGVAGTIGASLLNRVLRNQIEEMARQFIIGEHPAEALHTINNLRNAGFATVIDLLGEATVSEDEADAYRDGYLHLLDVLAVEANWSPLGNGNGVFDWGSAPMVQIAVKPTSLFSQTSPRDFTGSVEGILSRLDPIYRRIIDMGGFLCIDMESSQYVDITLEVYRRLRSRYPASDSLGIALQAYLKRTDADVEELIAWSRAEKLPVSVRLVKGAYWDFETIRARQNGWPTPVYTRKEESDAAFERHARMLLEAHETAHFACGSHNIRSICAVLEMAKDLGVPDERYEFQVLYGMAEPVRKVLLREAGRVRLYAPYGKMVPGMAYLVRRLLENTANESFLRQSFVEATDRARLLADPAEAIPPSSTKEEKERTDGFANTPVADFARRETRDAFALGLQQVRKQLGKTWQLRIGGEAVTTGNLLDSTNPADPTEVIGRIHLAGTAEIDRAIEISAKALPRWSATPFAERSTMLRNAAAIMRKRMVELACWQVLEVGKQWDQAQGDVAEAIDFLEYYARQAEHLANPAPLISLPGEANRPLYLPKGIAAVIAPWNFPLAISCGMVAAALVTGNCVLYKPSGLSPVTGALLIDILLEAGIPSRVLHYLPGSGSAIGDYLIEHPAVNLIAFTGSLEVGLRINEKAARLVPGQHHIKKVVCEMGGKNAIIVDDDADLDEAIPHILASAFGFQGQKCSACSRVIVLDIIYDLFVERLVAAAKARTIGPAENPAFAMGPAVDATAQQKILAAIATAEEEGKILFKSEIPDDPGWYVPMTIVGGIAPQHRTAQEEIFGPVLAVMRAKSFTEALQIANSTPFALTGGVFSRSPGHLDQARREFRVGNLYLNRGVTGALVGRQPFGGMMLSGGGTKAGGPDYLLHFVDPKVVTENTMRRGFAPEELE